VDAPPPDPNAPPTLALTPIGIVRSPFTDRAEAPRQPRAAEGVEATIELYEGRGYERALFDLEGWDYLWVLFWFHKNAGWRPQVLPPRSDRRRGVFSTRSPHRPNPIGLSVVRLLSVSKRTVRVANCDMLDQTPVLDLKPYVPWSDAIPTARTGWLAPPEHVAALGDDGRPEDPKDATVVRFDPLARAQLDWLVEHRCPVELEAAIVRVLSLGAHAHPYRRIRRRDEDTLELAVKDWRAQFRSSAGECTVLSLSSGYRADALASEPGLDLHRAFVARWSAELEAP
jgi:tRNA-Thr(GGU) m(6)t(6)A37 methyltransferase TsaA